MPLEGSVQVDLDPAGGRSHILSVIFCTPTLHEAHPDGTHLGQLVDGLEPVVDGLREKGGKLLVVEDLETAARRDFAHCCRVKPVVVVAVSRLDKDCRVGETLSVHLAANIIQMDTF